MGKPWILPSILKSITGTPPPCTEGNREEPTSPLIRPIHYAFDPVPSDHDIPTSSDFFPQLRECLQHPPHDECAYIQPTDLHVPWPTSFPAAVQCKHWQEVEQSARELLDEIVSEIQKEAQSRSQSQDKSGGRLLSTQLGASPDALPQKKLHEVLETAVTGTIYMFPAANVARARIMAKAILLIFLHDGMFTLLPYRFGVIRGEAAKDLEELTCGSDVVEAHDGSDAVCFMLLPSEFKIFRAGFYFLPGALSY